MENCLNCIFGFAQHLSQSRHLDNKGSKQKCIAYILYFSFMPLTASVSQTALRQQSFDFQLILYSQYMMVQCIFLALPAQTSV